VSDAVSEPPFDVAFARLFERRFGRMFSYLDRLTGDAELAADLAQEAFVRLYERGSLPDLPEAWLVTVAHNLLRDQRRRTRRRAGILGSRLGFAAAEPSAPDDAADRLVAEERRDQVRRALTGLGERDRRLLLLRHSGHSYREIAAALGVAETGIGTMLARATEAFRRAYREIRGASD
jgi:RNA polymerase sigma-70 factor (ECF subfamily)